MFRDTFSGGIHPSGKKHITAGKVFSNLSIPQVCYIPMQQHIGKPARPVVAAGDVVSEGQLIGAADGHISANVHASVPGKVVDIVERPTIYSKKGLCVAIEAQGAFDASCKPHNREAWEALGKEELLKKVFQSGIVGLGGAAFPTQVKLSPPKNKHLDTLVVNGSECEPYLTVDDMLMQTHPGEILEGISITLKILGLNKAYIGIENNKLKAIAALKKKISELSRAESIEVRPLKTKYPQGAEKQLIYGILKREVPGGGLPMDAGVVVQNVGTIFAIYEAVALNKPLFERYITVTGEIVRKPGNYKARIGTRIADVIEECGGLSEEPARIIMGGPMCGLPLDTMEIPVVKGTSGILFLNRKQINTDDYRPCIRCGKCVSVCPAGLVPCDLVNAIEKNRYDLVEPSHPFDCIMCGSCSYCCPSRRPLSHFIKVAQEKLRQKNKK